MNWQPKHTDAALWAAMSFFGAIFVYLTTAHDASQFLSPVVLFWLKGVSEAFTAMTVAIKLHRAHIGSGDDDAPVAPSAPQTPAAPQAQSKTTSQPS